MEQDQQYQVTAFMCQKAPDPLPEEKSDQPQTLRMKGKNESFFEFQDDEKSQIEKQSEIEDENKQHQNEEQHSSQNKSEENKEQNGIEDQKQQTGQMYESRKADDKFSIMSVLITIILKLIWNAIILYPFMILDELFFLLKYIFSFKYKKKEFQTHVINPISCMIFSTSIVLVCFETVKELILDYKKENLYFFWYIEAFVMFLTHTMIFSIIQMTKKNDFSLKLKNIFSLNKEDEDVLFIHVDGCFSTSIIDIPVDDKKWVSEYQRIIVENLEVDVQSQRFNTLCSFLRNQNIKQYIGFQLVKGQNKYLSPCSKQFLTLQLIMFLKIIFCVYYIYTQHKIFTLQDLFHISVITLFSINEVYCLNCMLSSYDLRRKTIMANNINQGIKLYGDEIDYTRVIDLTCPQSLETWDNSRRSVYDYYYEVLKKLEWTYTCLFFYYLLVFNIAIAAYGEIYIVIDKESILLQPLTVISSTFTFILLNTLILFRIYYGSKYNQVFDDTLDQINSISSIFSDMEQLYDYYFIQKGTTKEIYQDLIEQFKQEYGFIDQYPLNQSDHKIDQSNHNSRGSHLVSDQQEDQQHHKSEIQNQSIINQSLEAQKKLKASSLIIEEQYRDLYTCYDILSSKIMYASSYYIKNQQPYQGIIYKKEQENILQKEILKNTLKILKSIQKQLQLDSKLKCYQVFNLLKLDFQESFFTIGLGLLTITPQVISKFIEQFQQQKQNKF